jgi:DNA polymerase III delta subunit
MKASDVRKQIASGATSPLYLLEGDDPQSRHELAIEFASAVDEGLHAFNVESFHANEATTAGARDQLIGSLLVAARTVPMMSPRRIILVHEAERLLSPRKSADESSEPGAAAASAAKRKRALTPVEELEAYLEAPEPMTTLVFVAGALDGNRRLVKMVRKHAVAVDCGSFESSAEAARWVRVRLEKDGLTIESQAVTLLLGATGSRLGPIRAEVDKLALFAAGEGAVTARHVREMVVQEAEPGEDFALGRAIWNSDPREALREVAAQLDTGAQPPMVLGQIRAAAGRLKPDERARQGLDAVLQTDLAIKSSIGEPRHLLERLVIELCAGSATALRPRR